MTTINPHPADFAGSFINQGPGKFEGEPRATEYYNLLALDGDGEHFYTHAQNFTLFQVNPFEASAFAELGIWGDDWVVLWENDSGFVNLINFATRAAAEAFCHNQT